MKFRADRQRDPRRGDRFRQETGDFTTADQARIVPGGLTKEQTEAALRHDSEAFTAAIKAVGITPPQ
jgi:hypothetical protein